MGTKKGAAEAAAFVFNAFAECIVFHVRYFATPTSVMLNVFQHLNFGPEAVLEDWGF